jgi:hypothetical protein
LFKASGISPLADPYSEYPEKADANTARTEGYDMDQTKGRY